MATLAYDRLGGTRSAVLAALLLHPDEALHVRELARLTGASPGSLHRELRSLSELGLLIRQETGRQVFYRANRDCPVFDELAGLLRKTSGIGDVLRDALAPLAGQIDAAFVYGFCERPGACRALGSVRSVGKATEYPRYTGHRRRHHQGLCGLPSRLH